MKKPSAPPKPNTDLSDDEPMIIGMTVPNFIMWAVFMLALLVILTIAYFSN